MTNMADNKEKTTRVLWIDCAKTMAIIAVLIDHSNGVFYTSSWVATSSYFSVSVFVILAGMTQKMVTLRRKTISGGGQWARITRMLRDYAIAVFLLQCFYCRFFDLKTYINYLLNFNIQAPYYFLVFFIQLVAIAPILIQWNLYCTQQKHASWYHLLTFVVLGIIAAIAINYTYILPVHGGGQFLFGGTFLLLYYCGITLAGSRIFEVQSKIVLGIATGMLLGIWIVWIVLMHNGLLPFDKWMEKYWGNGFNPPSVQSLLYGVISVFLFYAMFSFLQQLGNVIINTVLKGIAWFGKYTLYIFMYHLLVRDAITQLIPSISQNIVIYRLVFIGMFVIPAVFTYIVQRISLKWKQLGRSNLYNENNAKQIG